MPLVQPPLGLYVHLPWCERKCPYCDFNSFTYQRAALPERRYVDAVLRDLDYEAETAGDREIKTVFIGGGTPSLFSGPAITQLLQGIRERVNLSSSAEITLEANPGSVEARRFERYREAGVNRLSIGIQSFHNTQLKALGRVHDGNDSLNAVLTARSAGFDNFNLDLMFGLPEASRAQALADLEQALDLAPRHLSWYQLTIEAGTQFAQKPPPLPSHDDIADLWELGQATLQKRGLLQYEVSAYAHRGQAAQHNLNYWTYGDYLGVGAGAHGKLTTAGTIMRRQRVRNPERYMRAAEESNAVDLEQIIEPPSRMAEFMLNALRLSAGFDLNTFETRTGLSADSVAFTQPLKQALDCGWLMSADQQIKPTALGQRFLNDLQMLFID